LVRRLFKDFRWGVLPVPGRLIAVIFLVALFISPLIVEVPKYLTFANIFVIFAP